MTVARACRKESTAAKASTSWCGGSTTVSDRRATETAVTEAEEEAGGNSELGSPESE
jgi:hypothetical protein